MSFATYYDYHGEIKHVGKGELKSEKEQLAKENDDLWQKILILMAMSPTDQKSSSGGSIRWADYIQNELKELREEVESNVYRMAHLSDAIECQILNPNSVHDDADEWDEEKEAWKDDEN